MVFFRTGGRLPQWIDTLRQRFHRGVAPRNGDRAEAEARPSQPAQPPRPKGSDDPADLVDQFLSEGRCALLLRPQVIENLSDDQLERTLASLEQHMALVPAGEVDAGLLADEWEEDEDEEEPLESATAAMVHVDALFMDRYAVTNAQYKQFVDAGGYDAIAIWDEEVLPALLDFVDSTGHPGPRFWQEGCFEPGREHHPVVGISWFEAAAYARWCGKRLPTDAEWTKAASWPVSLSPGQWLHRRFPWGDSFEELRANVWATGRDDTVAVDQFSEGISVGGVNQLVGNVWEWTSGHYGSDASAALSLPVPMRSIRGGAFDTYFENQASCQFQSGESPIGRKRNIGIRLALGACDLAPQAARQLRVALLETDPNACIAEMNA